jgi:hypothetical protein
MFPIRNVLKQGDALAPLFFNFALEYAIRGAQVNQDVIKEEEQKARTQYGTSLQGCQLQRHELHYSRDCATACPTCAVLIQIKAIMDCFFLSFKANATVKPAKTGHVLHSS